MSDVPEHLKGAWIKDPQTLDSQSLDVNPLTKEQLDALRAMSRCSKWRLLSDEQPNIGDAVLVFVKDMNPTHQVCEYFKESGLASQRSFSQKEALNNSTPSNPNNPTPPNGELTKSTRLLHH